MEFLTQLWLPILLSAVATFFASFIFWAVLPFHKNDYKRLPDEEAFSTAVRALNIPPGNYAFPYCENNKQQKDPAFIARMAQGPTGIISLWGRISMGRNMLLTVLACLLTSTVIAYLGWSALGAGADFMRALRIVGTAGVLAYSFGFIANDIWFGTYGRTIALKMLDGVVYGLINGLIFAALWPSGARIPTL